MNTKFSGLSPLRQWVISNKFFIRTTDTKENKLNSTHFLLDGGLWKIPLNRYEEFLKLLSSDLQNQEKYYISENRTDVFKYICDLDFYDEDVISLETVIPIINIIQNVISEYFGEYKIIICGTESKEVSINEKKYIKTGFHIIWPKLWVNQNISKILRILFIQKLIEVFGERSEYNTWNDVVDLAIYEDNGLRMVGCRKIGICKSCKNKKDFRDTCEKCKGIGKIDEGRIYKPIHVLNADQEYFKSLSDFFVMLLETSIYNYNSFPINNLIKNLPEVNITKIKKKNIVVSQDDQTIKIEKFIKKTFKETQSKIKIQKITKNEFGYDIVPDDNFCINVNRNHTSSGIYFQIRQSGISQRCKCKKLTTDGRLFGPCPDFSSKEIPLSKVLLSLLFETTIKTTRGKKKIANISITKSNNNSSLDLSIIQNNSDIISNNKKICLLNCKNILEQLKNDLILI